MMVDAPAEGVAPVQSPVARTRGFSMVVEGIIGAILAVTLLAYMSLGNYTRYVADDYGLAIAVKLRGFWAQQVAAYRLTDGHFVASALQTAVALLDPIVVRVLPGVLVLAWVAALTLALRHLIPHAGLRGRLLIGAGIVYTALRIIPNPFLTVYWMTASLAFVVPLLVASVVIWLVSRPANAGRRGIALLIGTGLLAFIASGEGEIYTVSAFVAWTLAVAVAVSRVSPQWRARLPRLAAAWIGATAGLLVELASPGNALRSAVISKLITVPRPSIVALPFFAFGEMLHFVHALVFQHWRGMLALAVLAALIAARSGSVPRPIARSGVIAALFATLGTALVVWAAMAPASLEFGSLPPMYDQLIPVFACICAIVTLGWLSGRVARNRIDAVWARIPARGDVRRVVPLAAGMVATAIVVAGPVATLVMIQRDRHLFQAYAAAKDAQIAAVEAARTAGRASAIVAPLPNVEHIGIFSHDPFEELTTNSTYWINQDTAEYYRVGSIVVSP
jgi:hypothetical protein